MPNWCWTCIKFYSKNEEAVKVLYEDFKKIFDEDEECQGFMGDYADHYFPEYGCERVDCRGRVDGIDAIDKLSDLYYFTMWTETAWGPKMGLWYNIVTRFYKGVEIAYSAEEPGCGLFCVWDETEGGLFFPETYYVDGVFPDEDGECYYIDDKYQFNSETEIVEFLKEKMPYIKKWGDTFDKTISIVEDFLETCGNEHSGMESLYFQVGEFVEVNPSEYNLLN